jgi:hypothetical protein
MTLGADTMIDDDIARHLELARRSGELAAIDGYGRPLPEAAGWNETPETLRMPFKVLKDADVVPREVELMRERARLREALAAASTALQRAVLQQRLADLEQSIALRLEALRRSAAL